MADELINQQEGDDLARQAAGPLQPNQQQGFPQQGPGLLQQLLPAIVTGLGAMATTSRWAGPGAAIGRGALAGLGAYEAGKPDPKVGAEMRQMNAHADYMEQRALEIKQQQRDVEAYKKTLSPDDAAAFAANPTLFNQTHMLKINRPGAEAILKSYGGFTDDQLKGLSDASIAKLSEVYAAAKAKSMYRAGKSPQLSLTDMEVTDPQTGQKTVKKVAVIFNPNNGSTSTQVIGDAKPTAAGAMTPGKIRATAAANPNDPEAQAAVKRLDEIEAGKLTNSTKTMLEAAPGVLTLADRVDNLVTQNAQQLGPAKGRWNEIMTGKVGAPNEEFTKLRTDVGLLSTLLMRMHVGARGGEYIMKHFQDMIDAGKQSPENLKAAISEIRNYAQMLQAEKAGGRADIPAESAAAPVPKATHRYNMQTGVIEEIK